MTSFNKTHCVILLTWVYLSNVWILRSKWLRPWDSSPKITPILNFLWRSGQISDVDDFSQLGLALESVTSEIDIDAIMRFDTKKYPNPEIFMMIRTDFRNRCLCSVGSTSREYHRIVGWYGCDIRNQYFISPNLPSIIDIQANHRTEMLWPKKTFFGHSEYAPPLLLRMQLDVLSWIPQIHRLSTGENSRYWAPLMKRQNQNGIGPPVQ